MLAGMITTWGGTDANIPAGWLLCDGSTRNQKEYAELFDAIGMNFGANPPQGQFYLPDLRGRFVRGQDPEGKRDPDSARRKDMQDDKVVAGARVGSVQADAFQDHTHRWGLFHSFGGDIPSKGHSGYCESHTGTVTDPQYRTSSETRPVNAYLIYIIKY